MTSQIVLLYLLKSVIIAGLFIAYYWIALRDKKFHYYNRFYLLSASVISVIAPLLNFEWFRVEEPVIYGSNEILQFVLPVGNVYKNSSLEWTDYVLLVTSLITISLLGLLFYHILSIQLLKRKCDVTPMDGFDFMNTNEDNAPFSFMNNLFWKQSISLQEEGGQQIFKHEITHIQQKHTWDRIYCQMVTSIFWMNPFNWIIQKELTTIHEFIADEAAVGNSNTEAFAKMLLQTHYGNHFLHPTHQFFYSSIKRRLAMLTKSNNTKFAYLRRVMVFPILIASVCLVSIKVHATEQIEKKVEEIKNNITLMLIDTIKPVKKDVLPSLPMPIAPSTTTPTNLPIYLDGVKLTEKEVNALSPNDIQSVKILEGEQAKNKYPEDGENVVIEIVSKIKGTEAPLQSNDLKKSNEQEYLVIKQLNIDSIASTNLVKANSNYKVENSVVSAKLVKANSNYKVENSILSAKLVKANSNNKVDNDEFGSNILILLDSIAIKPKSELQDKAKINQIESITISKDPSVISLYGEDGKNGVVLLTTKKWDINNLQNKEENAISIIKSKKNQNEGSGILIASKTQKDIDLSKNNDPIFYTAEKPAAFPGGPDGWIKYLKKNLNINLPIKNGAPAGTYKVLVSFVVKSNGEVSRVEALNNPGYGTATEAIRMIEDGPKWIPAQQSGEKVNYLVKQNFVFVVTEK